MFIYDGPRAPRALEGMTWEAREALRVAGAAERHAARVAALEAWVAEAPASRWLALALDQVGQGGRLGLTGDGTVRHPWLQGAGKGRKAASDGAAWTAAIAAAVQDETALEVEPEELMQHLQEEPAARPWVHAAAVLGQVYAVSLEAFRALRPDLPEHVWRFAGTVQEWAAVQVAAAEVRPAPEPDPVGVWRPEDIPPVAGGLQADSY